MSEPGGRGLAALPEYRRSTSSVVRSLLERMSKLQNAPLVAMTADNLQSDRQTGS